MPLFKKIKNYLESSENYSPIYVQPKILEGPYAFIAKILFIITITVFGVAVGG